jgi:hypothetical protein
MPTLMVSVFNRVPRIQQKKFVGKNSVFCWIRGILLFKHNLFPFLAHYGAITHVELHKAAGSVDFSRYCLTSSIDFTCKLWNLTVKVYRLNQLH